MGDATCTISGCQKKSHRRGWCAMHYGRFIRHGDANWQSTPLDVRFWAKVNKAGATSRRRPDLGPCWIWDGALAENGYGRFNTACDVQRPTHVLAFEMAGSAIPEGLELDHLCLVKRCVRPSHLEPVTHVENLRRADEAYGIRTAVTHCPQRHEYTEENTRIYRGRRHCRTCTRVKARNRMRRKRAQDVPEIR